MKRASDRDYSFIFILLIVAVVVATSVFVALQVRTNSVEQLVTNGEEFRTLLVVHDDGVPLVAAILFINPDTSRAALFDIPGNAGLLIPSRAQVDRLDTAFDPNDAEEYLGLVSDLFGVEIDFDLLMSVGDLAEIVDLLEGVDVFVTESFEGQWDDRRFFIPSGDVLLDGDKAVDFLRYRDDQETELERVSRRQDFLKSLLRKMGTRGDYLLHSRVWPYTARSLRLGVGKEAVESYVGQLGRLNTERMVGLRVQGNLRSIDIGERREQLLFPHFEGQWLRETVAEVQGNLAQPESDIAQEAEIRIEILNGTETRGLARRTRDIFLDYGFDVISFDNADRSDYDYTLVIDRRGNESLAQRASEIIRADRILSEPLQGPEAGIDVTIILGEDFDGRYVRQSSTP